MLLSCGRSQVICPVEFPTVQILWIWSSWLMYSSLFHICDEAAIKLGSGRWQDALLLSGGAEADDSG